MAIATSSLSVLVFSSDYWQKGQESGARAIPLIDVEVLLAALTPLSTTEASREGSMLAFDTRQTTVIDGETHKIQIQVSAEPEPVLTGPPPQANDFALTGPATELPAAHLVLFHLIHAERGTVIPSVWRGYLNATPTNLLGASVGVKRRRFQTMAE